MMADEMFCLHCQKNVTPRVKQIVDAVVWFCPLCGCSLDIDFTDEDEEDDDD